MNSYSYIYFLLVFFLFLIQDLSTLRKNLANEKTKKKKHANLPNKLIKNKVCGQFSLWKLPIFFFLNWKFTYSTLANNWENEKKNMKLLSNYQRLKLEKKFSLHAISQCSADGIILMTLILQQKIEENRKLIWGCKLWSPENGTIETWMLRFSRNLLKNLQNPSFVVDFSIFLWIFEICDLA